MKPILEYYTNQWEINATDKINLSSGIFSIKEELYRPDKIQITTSNKKQLEIILSIGGNTPNIYPSNYYSSHIKQLTYSNKYEHLAGEFKEGEFSFLKETFNFHVKKNMSNHDSLQADNSKVNPLYISSGYLVYLEGLKGETFVIIYFNRWETKIQPRGAGEDQLGENITYIHGVWESPLLTNDIIDKIKTI